MNDNFNQPQPYDLVLGGNNPPPIDGAVLGGIEGVKKRLQSSDIEVKIAALKDAVKYDNEGLDVLIKALQNESSIIVWNLYSFLISQNNSKIRDVLNKYHPYKIFKLLFVCNEEYLYNFTIDYQQSKIITINSRREINVWDINTGVLENTKKLLKYSDLYINVLRNIPNKSQIISGGSEGCIEIFSITTGERIKYIKLHPMAIMDVTITPDNKKIVSASSDNTIKIRHLYKKFPVIILRGHSSTVEAVAVTSDNQKIISGSSDKTIKIWGINSGKCLQTLLGHSDDICCLCLTPDNQKIISGSYDETIKIWDINSGKCLQTLLGHSGIVSNLCVTPDSKNIISASHDLSIKIWSIDSGECWKTLPISGEYKHPLKVCVTSDGQKIIANNYDNNIVIWGIE